MANQFLWSSTPLSFSTTIDDTNNALDITVNDVIYNLVLTNADYMTHSIRHESRLVDEINEQMKNNNVDSIVTCKLGVFADGNVKSAYLVLEYDDADAIDVSGTLTDIVGLFGHLA